MRVYLSPSVSDKGQTIKFNGDCIQITDDYTSYLYDFANVENGKMVSPTEHIISAERENGELFVEIINYITDDSTAEERFPQWQTINRQDELDLNTQVVNIEWYSNEQKVNDELLATLHPTQQELEDAELEIKVLTLLMEMEVI